MPNNWKTYKLGEVADVQNGFAFKSSDLGEHGIPVVKIKNIVPPNVDLTDSDCYLGQLNGKLEKYLLKRGDFLIAMTGSTVNVMSSAVGKMGRYRLDEKSLLNQRAGKIYVTSPELLDFDYLCHFLNRYEVHYNLALNATGSANQANISPAQIKDILINLPPLPEQRAIASILSSLDDKIELNLQMNKTLEEMAMTLYKHWFVDFEFPVLDGSAKHGVVNSPPQEGSAKQGVVRNTANYMSLPYNPKLKQRAKELRKAGNLAEVLFWQQVKNKQFKGLDFDSQKIIGNYIVDFYCANVNLVVEIDGSSHDEKQEYDAKRDAYLEGLGLTVIHIPDSDLLKNLKSTMNYLWNQPVFSPPQEGSAKQVNSPPQEGWPQAGVNSPPQEGWPQAGVVSTSQEELPYGEGVKNHPAFQAPLQRRGMGYRSSGGKFVDSELGLIPEGWEVKSIGDNVDILNSKRIPLSTGQRSVRKGKYPYYGASGIIDHIDDYIFEGEHVIISEDGENLRSRKTPVAFMAHGQFWVNNHAHILKGKVNGINELLIHHLKQLDLNPYLTGAVQPKLNKQNLLSICLPFPNSISAVEPVLTEFYSFSRLVLNNILENQTLTTLRDTLLPKLISGEVRVKDAEQTIAQAL